MEVKANVRQRRKERIKQLEKNISPMQQASAPPTPFQQDTLTILRPGERRAEGPLHDPEFIWKQRMHRDWGAWRGEPVNDSELWRRISNDSGKPLFIRNMFISLVLFALVWGLFQLNHPWAEKGQHWVTKAMTEPFQFDQVAEWYETAFAGAPSFIPAFDFNMKSKSDSSLIHDSLSVPVLGTISLPFASTERGIELETKAEAPIAALGTGRVIFVGNTLDTGWTVMIQHAEKVQSTYGYLADVRVEKNDWVEGGSEIASVARQADGQTGKVYFSIQKGGKFIDPADVISFD